MIRLKVPHIAVAVMAWLLLISVLAYSQGAAGTNTSSTKRDAEVVKDFKERVKQYMEARTRLAGKSPKPTRSAIKLAETQQQMAERIRAARSDAQPGNIFTPAIADYFRRQIATTLTGPEGGRIRASLRHAEPLKAFVPKVNENYPGSVALQSTPPTLLLNLPNLPKELQYRIVGNYLVLHDTGANLIVDFIPNVMPTS